MCHPYVRLTLVAWWGTCEAFPASFYLLLWVWAIAEKLQTRGGSWGCIYFFENKPGSFRFVTFPLENKLSPLKILQICVTPLGGNFKFKNQDPCQGNSTTSVFRENPWKFHFFFNWSLEFAYVLSLISLVYTLFLFNKCPQPSVTWIFSGITHCSCKL